MAAELGGKQLSTLLESLPGIASVLRSPVADAIVNLVRAGAGIAEFNDADAKELVQYATRRGLLGADEGAKVLEDVREAGKAAKAGKKTKTAAKKTAKKPAAKKAAAAKKPPAPKKTASTATAKKATKKRKK
jgi:polyhydroxyalkanoate synthesis regulator phasin